MKLRWIAITILLATLFVTGCSKKESPEERLQQYIAGWTASEFSTLYTDYLTKETKNNYDAAEFVERQEKLADDLSIENVKVTYTKPKENTEWSIEEPATFKIHVSMDTIAGPVDFKKEIALLFEEQQDEKHWNVQWDPSFIFPGMTATDTIQIKTTKAIRGKIFDRNGNPIAMNGTGFEAGIVPGKFTDESKKDAVAQLLNVSVDFIDSQLNQSWVQPDYFVPIASVSKTNVDLLDKLISIPGMTYQETTMREYPYGESLAHLSGYIGKMTAELLEKHEKEGYGETDLIGRQGMERILEKQLRGQNGIGIYMKGAESGSTLETIIEQTAVDGENVSLTIDAELQKNIFDAMKGEPGAAAAVDPMTGETLALVSSPSFDPAEFMLGISGDRYTQLSEDPLKPLFNRFAASYAPGSAIKPITAAIGLELGTLKPNEGLSITGKTWSKNTDAGAVKVTRVHPEAPNPIDLNKALVYSDNIYFAQQALTMGNDELVKGFTAFGFGEKIPFPLNLSPSQVSNNGTLSSARQLADTAYGQGEMLTNILHLATLYEPILTNGIMYKPTLFSTDDTQQVWNKKLLNKEHAAILRTDLRNVVVDGFAQAANLEDMQLAGKTGTAELKKAAEEDGQENGYFVSYNSNNPQFILAMMIESIEDNDGSGYVAELAVEAYKSQYAK